MLHSPNFSISREAKNLGIRVICMVVSDLQNASYIPEFDIIRQEYMGHLRSTLSSMDCIKHDPVLAGFRALHDKVGRSNKKYPSSPESLIRLFFAKGIVPQINPVVDIYNIVSLDTRLSLGAHDVDRVSGNIVLRMTNGSERFVPLGSSTPVPVSSGEYCYIDDSNDVLCMLEHKQCEKTKIGRNTRSCFLIVQGNEATSPKFLEESAARLSWMLARFCSGLVTKIWDETN